MNAARKHADRVDRITNDPGRIEKRKSIAPAVTAPRRRPPEDDMNAILNGICAGMALFFATVIAAVILRG